MKDSKREITEGLNEYFEGQLFAERILKKVKSEIFRGKIQDVYEKEGNHLTANLNYTHNEISWN